MYGTINDYAGSMTLNLEPAQINVLHFDPAAPQDFVTSVEYSGPNLNLTGSNTVGLKWILAMKG